MKIKQSIPYDQKTDEELALMVKRRDEMAFKELMRRYLKAIYNFVHQYSRSDDDTEDIAQDTFYKIWKYKKRYSRGRQWRPWLYTIARNTALDYVKKKKAIFFSDLDDAENDLQFAETLEDQEPLAMEMIDNEAMVADLKESLRDFHPDHRAVLTLHYKEDLTFEEIATIMEKPMNTVKSWHRRALQKLKTKLVHHD